MKFSFNKLDSVLVIAELSANHNGSLEIARDTIKAAKRAGADAIKLQTYTPDTITIQSTKSDFLIKSESVWDGKYLYDLYKEAYTPWEWHKELFKIAKDEGLLCFSTPFDSTAVDLLEDLGVQLYKIASFEITDIPLIEYIASKGKPIMLSTGIARLEDINLAINTIKEKGNNEIALLQCTSSYPVLPIDANLKMITDFIKKFKVVAGLSDHTLGINAPIIAVSLGAKIIEKHFIVDKSLGGPDSSFSLDENEFSKMVKAVRETEELLGNISYELTKKQKLSKQFSRSLYVTEDIKKGEKFNYMNVRSIRPGFGLHPKELKNIIGKYSNQDIEKGERFSLKFIK
jgi:pseudaminic acid synthase